MDVKLMVLSLVGSGAEDSQLDACIALARSALAARLSQYGYRKDIPESLTHIVVELAVARFNRVGAEGMTEESVEGHHAKYQSFADLLEEYDGEIREAATEGGIPSERKVRFL